MRRVRLCKFDSFLVRPLTIAATPTHQARWSVDTHTHTHYSDISWDVLNKHVSLYNLTNKHSIWWSTLVAVDLIRTRNNQSFSSNTTFVFFGTLHGAVSSFLLCLGWPESLAARQQLPLASEQLLRQVPILYQWLKPRLWLFTLRATSSWKQISSEMFHFKKRYICQKM